MPLTLRYTARSHPGLVREGNEDSGYAGPYLLAVADGMGGHAAGEVASQAAIDELVQVDRPPDGTDARAVLADALAAANERIRRLATDDTSLHGMGTTATLMLWDGAEFGVAHIGDSRAYCLRDDELTQVTHDHTFVQALVDDGRLSPTAARDHPARSVVTKVLQGHEPIEPDYAVLRVRAGDRVLICSDGLSDVVDDDAVGAALRETDAVDETADRLIELAVAAGAPDNVTVVVIDVVATESAREPDDTAEAFLVGAMAADPRRRENTSTDRPDSASQA
ncbi:serine/threonine protein phosphatase PrpC [Haloactinopolyspora alba]|uniref:Serine/threonine protein phosphatase PrpC n=1 Tax=Haloactinopolyspora alba TaxID=648780 RepID=A0A2P8E6X1_9ACTN|nr:protein phosphatase 2C domain-containing protein [Haloactinopolyspora alba]PSL05177.1 serine/threonine protein phosphatase PrpC [Haloactinopolyspora alba]